MKRAKLFFLFLVVVACVKCTKNDNDSNVPLAQVNVTVNINQPAYFNLQTVGGWEYLNGGSRGLLVYRNGPEEFRAFDRHSPYNLDANCRVFVDSTNIFAVDTCSGSRFLIIDGSVETGPAARPLTQYQTTYNGTVLQIYN